MTPIPANFYKCNLDTSIGLPYPTLSNTLPNPIVYNFWMGASCNGTQPVKIPQLPLNPIVPSGIVLVPYTLSFIDNTDSIAIIQGKIDAAKVISNTDCIVNVLNWVAWGLTPIPTDIPILTLEVGVSPTFYASLLNKNVGVAFFQNIPN